MTDHRIGLTKHNLEAVIDGNLGAVHRRALSAEDSDA